MIERYRRWREKVWADFEEHATENQRIAVQSYRAMLEYKFLVWMKRIEP